MGITVLSFSLRGKYESAKSAALHLQLVPVMDVGEIS